MKDTLIKIAKQGDFLILDTETTGLSDDAEICQIAIIDPSGNTLLDTLVKPYCPIQNSHIHGITNAMVADAPQWNDVRHRVKAVLSNKTVITYNAAYDFKLLCQSSSAASVSDAWYVHPRECAMLAYAEHAGVWDEYHGNWKWVKLTLAAQRVRYKLPAGIKQHSALGDCLICLAVVKHIARLQS